MNRIARRERARRAPLVLAGGNHRLRGQFGGAISAATITVTGSALLSFGRGSLVVHPPSATGVKVGRFESIASLGSTTTTLSASVSVGATTVQTASALSVGWYWIGATTITHQVDASTADFGGELVYVTSGGTTSTLRKALVGGYSSGASVRRIDVPVTEGVTIRGLRTLGDHPTSPQGLSVGLVQGLLIDGCSIQGSINQAMYIVRCRDVVISNCNHTDIGFSTGTGYGVSPNQCQNVTIKNITAFRSRHGVSITRQCHLVSVDGIVAIGGSTVSGGTFTYGEIASAGFDDHDGSSRVTIANVRTDAAIKLGNSSWRAAVTNYSVSNCSAAFLIVGGDVQGSSVSNSSFSAIQYQVFATAGGWTNRFKSNVFTGVTVAGSSTNIVLTALDVAINGSADVSENRFVNSTITGYGIYPAVRIDDNLGSLGNYTLRFEGSTLTSGAGSGSRIASVRNTNGATGNIKFEFVNSSLVLLPGTATAALLSCSTTSGAARWASSNSTVTVGAASAVAISASHVAINAGAAAWAESVATGL